MVSCRGWPDMPEWSRAFMAVLERDRRRRLSDVRRVRRPSPRERVRRRRRRLPRRTCTSSAPARPCCCCTAPAPGRRAGAPGGVVAEALAARHRVDRARPGRLRRDARSRAARRARRVAARGVGGAGARASWRPAGARRYAVVGHSMGGAVALALAAAERLRVTRVVGRRARWARRCRCRRRSTRCGRRGPGRRRARDARRCSTTTPALVTDEAVRRARRRDGARAPTRSPRCSPPPRERWVRDLTLDADALAAVVAPGPAGARRARPAHAASRSPPSPCSSSCPTRGCTRSARCGHVPAVEHQRGVPPPSSPTSWSPMPELAVLRSPAEVLFGTRHGRRGRRRRRPPRRAASS